MVMAALMGWLFGAPSLLVLAVCAVAGLGQYIVGQLFADRDARTGARESSRARDGE